MSEYTDKLSRAQIVIDEHNIHLSDDKKLDWNAIKSKIAELGGTSEETLSEMTWEDLQDCGIPRVLARRIANQIFRQAVIKRDDIETMSISELFRNYDPTGEKNPSITERLRKESEGKKCVVFLPTGVVDEVASKSLLMELKGGLPERDHVGIAIVYRIGENPNQFLEENFLFPGNPLRNGVCDITNRNLTNIPLEVRQIVYLAITNTKELRCENAGDAHTILDMLEGDEALDKIQSRYVKAAIALNKMKELGQAPSLKLERGKNNKNPNDPFYKHRRY